MSFRSDALNTKHTESAVGSEKRKITFESLMVNIGSLTVYLSEAAVKRTLFVLGKASAGIARGAGPLGKQIFLRTAKRVRKIKNKAAGLASGISAHRKRFSSEISENGFGKAFCMQLSDLGGSVKDGRKLVKTIVNHAAPVAGIAALVIAVSGKASADYGVTVGCNGREIGVVSEESVVSNAQEVIADRAVYYDINGESYMTAVLSIRPLGAQDEVIDEMTLADAIQEQIETAAPAAGNMPGRMLNADADKPSESIKGGITDKANAPEINNAIRGMAGEGENAENTDFTDGGERERAFVVMVDGEVIGAVKETDEIADYLDNIKDEYLDGDVVDVSFDRNIEYTYEQYVDADDIVDQRDIIDKFGSNVSEPVYYEIREGDNPWNIARDNGITTDELKECNITFKGEKIDDITEYCPIGALVQLSEEVPYLQVLTTKEVEYTEAIDYEIVKTEDPDMYKGDSVVEVAGVEGEKTVRAMVTYRGDTVVSRDIVDEEVISEPVTKYMRVGTRETTTPVSTGSGGSGEYFWPVDGGYISAYQGDGRGHKGIDIAAPYGTPIYAAESGTVIETGDGWNGGYGNCVRVQHDDGNVTVYAHQSSIAVSYGDYVVKGQLLGYVGSTGDSTGNHLHFEVRSYGTYANPLDYVSQD